MGSVVIFIYYELSARPLCRVVDKLSEDNCNAILRSVWRCGLRFWCVLIGTLYMLIIINLFDIKIERRPWRSGTASDLARVGCGINSHL